MVNLDGIKNIFFDLGGVFIDLDKERCLNEFRKLGVENIEKHIDDSFKSGFILQFENGMITPAEFRNEIRKLTGKQVTDEEIDHAWNSFVLDIPPSRFDILLELRKNYRVFMVSNSNKIHSDYVKSRHFRLKEGLSVDDYFEKCYLSFELHLSKPDKAIFEAIIKDAGVLPQESLFIDDNLQNIESARSLGFRTYWVSDAQTWQSQKNADDTE